MNSITPVITEDFTSGYVGMTDDEIKLDLLKAAVVNPDLYNTMASVLIGHACPQHLDSSSKRLRRIFMELSQDHGHTTDARATASPD